MADLSDVENALVGLITAAVYPNGTGQPSIAPGGAGVAVYAGWPLPAQLDADFAALGAGTGGKLHISVFPRPEEQNVTRFPKDWQDQVAAAPTLTLTAGIATVDGFAGTFYPLWGSFVPISGGIYQYPTITVGGTISTPQNAVVFVNGTPFVYAVQAADTLTTIATALAALINAQVPGTTSAGPVITMNAPVQAVNLQFGVGDGVTTAFPLVPSGYTIIGTPSIFRTGYAISCGAASDVNVPNTASLSIGAGDFTLEWWFRPAATPGSGNLNLISKGGGFNAGASGVEIRQRGSGSFEFIRNPGNSPAPPRLIVSNFAAAGAVTHALLTYDFAAGTLTVYKNGLSVGSVTYTGNDKNAYTDGAALLIGKGVDSFWNNGPIDGVRLYTRKLSASEAVARAAGQAINITGLGGWWRFDEGTGTVALDSSGNNNGGTLVGGPAYVASIDPDSLRTSPIDYSLSKTGLVTWTQPPPAGAILNWTGSYSPSNATINALRVGASGQSIMEVRRQIRTFQITVWANSEANRSGLVGPVDAALANIERFNLPDQTSARLIYKGSPVADVLEKANIYRRDLIYTVEYATTVTRTDTQVTAEQLNVSPQIDGATAISATNTIFE